ncbi:MAG: hypothetical protein AAF289_19255, partial [Cyanobacteria bacterium P01_A01_bin.135]
LPELSMALLPALMVGLVLVGLFSATISTADAQLLSCSAALTQDLLPGERSYHSARLGTLGVVVFVTAIALVSPGDVFTLVTFAWAALAASLGSVMVVRVMGWPLTGAIAAAMMGSGIGTALIWRFGLNLSGDVYEVLPAMAMSGAVYGLGLLVAPQPTASEPSTLSDTLPEAEPNLVLETPVETVVGATNMSPAAKKFNAGPDPAATQRVR